MGAAAVTETGRNIDIETCLKECFKKVTDVKKSEEDTEWKVHDLLADILEVANLAASGPHAERVLAQTLEEKGIGSTNRSTDMFTRLIKLVFGKKCPRASTSRYANTLWLADDDGIHPDDFTQYVARMGGLEKCSR
jgi:hypothetical protein